MSNSYLFTYTYDMGNGGFGIGSIIIHQEQYVPINSEVLNDCVRIVKEQLRLPDDRNVVPLSFHRFEV